MLLTARKHGVTLIKLRTPDEIERRIQESEAWYWHAIASGKSVFRESAVNPNELRFLDGLIHGQGLSTANREIGAHENVEAVCECRAHVVSSLGLRLEPIPSTGRIHARHESDYSQLPGEESGGLLDDADVMPCELWLAYAVDPSNLDLKRGFRESINVLLSWIPGPLVEKAEAAIYVDPVCGSSWLEADWNDACELVRQLRARGFR